LEGQDNISGRLRELSPLGLYILFHLRRANVDYAGSISRVAEVPIERVLEELDRLEAKGLIQRRVGGSSIKRSEARFKLSDEVRKHHVYYELSREGEELVRELMRNPGGSRITLTGWRATGTCLGSSSSSSRPRTSTQGP